MPPPLCSLIFVASYTANLAAVLTSGTVDSAITLVRELYGKNVASHSAYTERLLQNQVRLWG